MKRFIEHFLGSPSSKRMPQTADRFRWVFKWPPEVMARNLECSTFDFASWLLKDGIHARYSRRELISRYAEFIELTVTRPITGWHRFDLSLKPAGIRRVRSSSGSRPWLYRVDPPQMPLTMKRPRPKARSLDYRA